MKKLIILIVLVLLSALPILSGIEYGDYFSYILVPLFSVMFLRQFLSRHGNSGGVQQTAMIMMYLLLSGWYFLVAGMYLVETHYNSGYAGSAEFTQFTLSELYTDICKTEKKGTVKEKIEYCFSQKDYVLDTEELKIMKEDFSGAACRPDDILLSYMNQNNSQYRFIVYCNGSVEIIVRNR